MLHFWVFWFRWGVWCQNLFYEILLGYQLALLSVRVTIKIHWSNRISPWVLQENKQGKKILLFPKEKNFGMDQI